MEMDYNTLITQAAPFPLFDESLLSVLGGSKQAHRLSLTRWVKSGKIIRLKRGLYTLPDDRRKIQFSVMWLANTLYSPSYVSLQFALSWHDMIPERVLAITSISRLKTARFSNPMGIFTYSHLNKGLFFGFQEKRDEFEKYFLMATPEKALLDVIYLSRDWEPNAVFLEKNWRLQQLEQLNKKRLKSFAVKFRMKKITNAVDLILKLI